MIDFDFNDDLNAKPVRMTPAEVRKQAHIANGGEASFPCPKCRGTGQTPWGRCFKCNGAGAVSKGVIAAAKGKITKERNIAQWASDHAAEIAYINERADRWDFMASMASAIQEWGKLTENQLAAVQRAMAKDAAKKIERAEARKAEAPQVEISAIEALFATARSNGLKRLGFRATDIEIKEASPTGKNPGALYVTRNGEYQGKVQNGQFFAVREANAETKSRLLAVAADPLGEAQLFGKQTGTCSCCGRELENALSVELGIGPVCRSKWGI